MKVAIILIFIELLVVSNCSAQNKYNVLDSLESSFERIKHNMAIPCQFEATFNRRENGKPFFTTIDSSQLEFDFFKVSSIPFFNSKEIIFKTISFYYDWILKGQDTVNSIKLTKFDKNKDYGYFVYQIQDASGKYYRLLEREGDVLLSIKIFDNKMSTEDQLEKLQILYSLNKN